MKEGALTKVPRKGVVVMGGHVQGLGIVRIFGAKSIPCILLDKTQINITRHSRYCSKFIKIDPSKDIIEFLININHKYNLKDWLLLPTDDNYVRILSLHKTTLEKFYKVGLDDWDVIEKCYNKRITYKLVRDLKLDMPETHCPDNLEELESLNISFPCIIKPAVMHKLYDKIRKKVFVCSDKNELISNYNKVLSYIPADEVIIQEIIPGDSYNQYSACFFFNRDWSVVSLLVRRKRQYPPDFGYCATFVESIKDQELFEIAQTILKKIGFWGLCEVEFKMDERDGKYKFLEINPRTWKWHSLANSSGSPFLMSLYHSVYFDKLLVNNDWKDCCWRDLVTDTAVVLGSPFYLKSLSVFNKNLEHAVFNIHDLKPFIFEIIFLPYLFFMR